MEKILFDINNSNYHIEDYALRIIDNYIDCININAPQCINLNINEFYDFILIKNKDEKHELKYVGIIYDMINDLHIFITPEFRGKQYLHSILNSSLFPFLSCYKDREKQRLSFENSKIKDYFIREFHFESIGKFEVEKNLNDDDVLCYQGRNEQSITLSDELKEKMVKNLKDAFLKIRMIHRQLEYSKYDNFDIEKGYLDELFWEIRDDIMWNEKL